MLENKTNEVTLIYHSDKPDDKKARGYVESITLSAIKTLDLKRDPITEMQLAEIADKLKSPIISLFDPTYADRAKDVQASNLSDDDIVRMLAYEPILIATPILIVGKKAFRYNSSYELIKLNGQSSGVENIRGANIEEKRTFN
jgi:arsenate reductase-like glutaredoxin family protein